MTQFKWGGEKREDKESSNTNLDEINNLISQEIKFVARGLRELSKTPTPEEILTGRAELKVLTPDLAHEKLLIHRSAILTHRSCRYKSYLEFFYKNHGITSEAIPQHLLIGICIHRGLQHLLEHCRVEHPNGDFEEACIDKAVGWAHETFREILSKRSLELKSFYNKESKTREVEDLNYTIGEVNALIEALIRSYAVFRLKEFLEEYEVLEVEHEEVFDNFSSIVTWLGKADGLLRRKKDNKLVILSIKTASEFGSWTMSNITCDMQGLSEIAAVEDRLNFFYRTLLERNHLEISYNDNKLNYGSDWTLTEGTYNFIRKHLIDSQSDRPIQVFGNQYEFLIKGKHKKSSINSNQYHYFTPLLHPIKNDSIINVGLGGLRFGNYQSSGGEYEWYHGQGKLPKGKRKIDIYNDIGVKEWIDRLAKGEIQPELGSPFQDIIIAGEDRLICRSREEIEEWRISTQYEAEEVAKQLAQINQLEKDIRYHEQLSANKETGRFLLELKELYRIRLLQFFPKDGKDKQLCFNYYGDECPFAEHCHRHLNLEDAIETGFYIKRTPHHALEVERFKEKGFLE